MKSFCITWDLNLKRLCECLTHIAKEENVVVIGCYLVTEGRFERAALPQSLLVELVKSLKEKGKETVHFSGHFIEVEGIYIPGKGSKTQLMCLGTVE